MGIKSRENWAVNVCIKRCLNRDKITIVEGRSYNFCEECIGNSKFKPRFTDQQLDKLVDMIRKS